MNEELKVKITAVINDFKQNINEAKKALGDFSNEGDKADSKLKKAFEKIGAGAKKVGKVIAGAMVAAIAVIGKQALAQYSSFEQLQGGIKTLYGNAANEMMNYAQNAYKVTGMSANQYLELSTSFAASLLQSLNGDQQEAAKVTDMMVQDMADNASVFGTSMEDIQNAYKGFAKQNYTMLDNLKLGYGGTQEEMQRLLADAEKFSGIHYDINNLNDVAAAIHVVQEEMGMTGNAANEAAKTIQGSWGATKAAWQNLLTGFMDETANIPNLINQVVESGTNLLSNIMPRIQQFAEALPEAFKTTLPQIVPMFNELLVTLIPAVTTGISELVTAVIDGLPQIVDAIVAAAPMIIDAAVQIGNSLINALPAIVESIVAALPTTRPLLINGIITLITTLANSFNQIIQPIIAVLPQVIKSVITALVANIPALVEGAIQLVLGIVEAIDDIINALIPMIPYIVVEIVAALIKELPTLLAGVIQIAVALVKALIDYFAQWVATWPRTFALWIQKIVGFGKDLVTGFVDKIKELKDKVGDKFEEIKNKIGDKIGSARDKVKTIIDKIKSFFKFEWNLPKLKMPHVKISGEFSLVPPKVPKFSIDWYAKGGVFDKPNLFGYGNGSIGGLGEAGAEAVVPLEKNTEWLDRIAERLANNGNMRPVILQVNGKTFAETSIDCMNDYARQTGSLPLKIM